jgi:flavin reductase (DIM6/NTAB) family NADH-FMN oxidoreductase RutF
MNETNNVFGWLPCSVVFISTAHGEERDIMTATAMFVSEKEPLLMISVAKNHLTEKLITQSGKFTVVIAGEEQKQLSLQLGSVKGEGVDKFKHFSVNTIPAEEGEALIPEGAAAWLACETESSQEITGYQLFIGRVVKQNDTGNPPLVWRNNGFFSLKPVK